MSKNKTIGVIGGTGKAGKFVVSELLAKGYAVKMLVRKLEKIPAKNSNLQIIVGDARDYQSLFQLFDGCYAVISTLGQTRDSTVPMFAGSTEFMLQAMVENNLRRVILLLGLNLEVEGDRKSALNLASTEYMKNTYPEFSAEKQKIVKILKNFDLDWTVVRIPFLIESEEKSQVLIDLYDCHGPTINAADLAGFIVEQLDEDTYFHKYPFISSIDKNELKKE